LFKSVLGGNFVDEANIQLNMIGLRK